MYVSVCISILSQYVLTNYIHAGLLRIGDAWEKKKHALHMITSHGIKVMYARCFIRIKIYIWYTCKPCRLLFMQRMVYFSILIRCISPIIYSQVIGGCCILRKPKCFRLLSFPRMGPEIIVATGAPQSNYKKNVRIWWYFTRNECSKKQNFIPFY